MPLCVCVAASTGAGGANGKAQQQQPARQPFGGLWVRFALRSHGCRGRVSTARCSVIALVGFHAIAPLMHGGAPTQPLWPCSRTTTTTLTLDT